MRQEKITFSKIYQLQVTDPYNWFSGARRKAQVSEWHRAKLTLKIHGKESRYFIP
jgi:hypothetical protein